MPRVAVSRALPHRGHAQRYGLLLVALFASLFVQGAVSPSAGQQVVVSTLVGGSLLLAFWAAGLSRRWLLIASALAVTVVALSLVRAITGGIGEGAARTMNGVLVALGPPAIAVGVVRNLRATGGVRIEAVMGVLSFYILLGMLFAFVFGALDDFGAGPFFASSAPATVSNCLYFSFTTLATVGYGDLTARTNLGHTLSILEALMGQIYLVTVVSLIVSNLRRPAASTAD
jgi:Ion channel